MTPDPRPGHRSFLLRLWQAGNGDAPEWRFSLEDVRTHERHGFTDMDSLVTFLEEQIRGNVQLRTAVEPSETEQE